jgi:predicted HTH transcriptional regulator
MFANAGGGILLIGIVERRDSQGQPTGSPDPNAQIGINIPNPELVLQSHDASAVATIEDRLPLESFAIPVANGRHVLAIRVPNSMATPHCVRVQGHVYFPSRRERHRYEMDIREIKEMVMRTASRLEQAEDALAGGASGLSATK